MTRPPIIRASYGLPGELVVDNFAGGGGASIGIEAALGRPPDIAINHSAEAIAMHRANHPDTKHYCEDIWRVDPREACGSRPVGLAWFSPDCTHFSRAKGNVPRKKSIRGLAWVVVKWARKVRPRLIVVENVEEFQTWGPLTDDGYPDPSKAGTTFRLWLNQLVGIGYRVDVRSLVAADYGTPTTRKRLFVVARRDGAGIAWPEPSHGAGRPAPWRTAAEIIDWSLPCPSIFDRRRPLAEATLRRIAAGLRKFVIDAQQPFVVPLTHQGGPRGRGVFDPLQTITGAHRGELALVAPSLVETEKPLRREVAGGSQHALVAAFLARHFGGVVGRQLELPVPTVTSVDHHSLTTAFLMKFYGTAKFGASCRDPVSTITAHGGHLAEVSAFLVKYYGSGSQQQSLFDPLHTVTSKARFGIVTIGGQDYQIADIGMRMLQPHELFAAQGFPDDYDIAPDFNGRPLSKSAQIALCGNAVCPQVAAAIVAANARRGAEVAA